MTILVVDDDVDTCRNLSDILTDLGYRVDTARRPVCSGTGAPQPLRPGPAQLQDARHAGH